VPGNSSTRKCSPEIGNGCTAKTFELPNWLLTLRPSAATVAVVLVLFHRFPWGLQTLLVLIQSIHYIYYFIEFTILILYWVLFFKFMELYPIQHRNAISHKYLCKSRVIFDYLPQGGSIHVQRVQQKKIPKTENFGSKETPLGDSA
jgi:hypothetical protein